MSSRSGEHLADCNVEDEAALIAICLAGGVAANSELRERTLDHSVSSGIRAFVPSRSMCTDNAAMIATAAWWRLERDGPSGLDLGAEPGLKLPWID